MNFIIARSNSVRVSKVMVSSPGDSPNTDGIHITGSTNVILQDCKIGTGDDCVSIVNASSNIKMKNIYCGPGHGIRYIIRFLDNTCVKSRYNYLEFLAALEVLGRITRQAL